MPLIADPKFHWRHARLTFEGCTEHRSGGESALFADLREWLTAIDQKVLRQVQTCINNISVWSQTGLPLEHTYEMVFAQVGSLSQFPDIERFSKMSADIGNNVLHRLALPGGSARFLLVGEFRKQVDKIFRHSRL